MKQNYKQTIIYLKLFISLFMLMLIIYNKGKYFLEILIFISYLSNLLIIHFLISNKFKFGALLVPIYKVN